MSKNQDSDRLTKGAMIIEIVGIAVVGAGIGIEIGYGAHVGFMLITGGSLLVALGGVIWAKVLRL